MFKLFVLSCLIAVAFAAPGGVVVAPAVVHSPIVHAHAVPVAVSHSSSHVVHSAPVVKTIVPVAHHVPVVPVVKTVVPVHPVHTVHAVHHPVVVHH